MHKTLWTSVLAAFALGSVATAQDEILDILRKPGRNPKDPAQRAQMIRELRQAENRLEVATRAKAKQRGLPMREVLPGGKVRALERFIGDKPFYIETYNANAAISTAANVIRQQTPYQLDGSGITVGIWDGGLVRGTHQEFNESGTSRILYGEDFATDNHATHVGGTIAAAGINATAQGMAPAAKLLSYEFNVTTTQRTNAAATTANQHATKIYLSNHSYGASGLGWVGNIWYGTGTDQNAREQSFGQYSSTSRSIDMLLHDAPYYLEFYAAGNERTNNPSTGANVTINGVVQPYDPAIHPPGDGKYLNGFGTIAGHGSAKNNMTIGSVLDAVSGGTRSLTPATPSAFTSWGPTDDGRIKPDLVANGQALTSTVVSSDTAYGGNSGTSMACPNATGSAALLVDQYKRLFNSAMRASTLKGLLIHTADDLGNAGPDYKHGWGLMNVQRAADQIRLHHATPNAGFLIESQVNATTQTITRTLTWDGTSPIRATLCWTDPEGSSTSVHDNRTARLVNNLNLKLIAPDNTEYFPFVMPYVGDWTTATLDSPATTGVNNVDPVEQVFIATPTQSGEWRVEVTYAGSLTNNAQDFGLILSGILDETPPTLQSADIVDNRNGAGIVKNNPVTYTVIFSEDMDDTSVSTSDFANAGTATTTINSATETHPGVFTVSATPTSAGTLRLSIPAGATLTDPAGNALLTTSAILDDTIIQVIDSNELPVVDAGTDQTITMLATAVATLDATVSDADGQPLTLTWSKTSGPGTVSFGDPSLADTTATFGSIGTYVLRLTAFDGFGSSFDEITVDVVQLRTLVYDAHGATGGSAPVDSNSPYVHGATVTVLGVGDLAWPHHTFVGWNTAADGSGTIYQPNDTFSITADTTLYAQWTPDTYTVTFDANNGESPIPASMTVSYGMPYGPLATTTRSGYTFLGWFTDTSGGTQVTSDSMVSATADHTLHARWNAPPSVSLGEDQSVLMNTPVPWTPEVLPGLAAWYDAADESTITKDAGNKVSQWRDKSGNDYHVNQATDTAKPLSGTRTLNNLNTVEFSRASAQLLVSSDNISSQPLTAFAVASFDTAGQELNVFDGSGGTRCLLRRSTANILAIYAGAWTNGAAMTTGATMASAVFNGASSSIRKDGGTAATGSPGTGALASGLTIGNVSSATTATYGMDGLIGEVIMASGSLTDTERQKAEGYLARQWGLLDNLRIDHPYKVTAPTFPAGALADPAATASDAENDPLTYTWTVISGPGSVTFSNPSALNSTASFRIAGTYVLRLTVSDGLGSSSDDITITVSPVTYTVSFDANGGTTPDPSSKSVSYGSIYGTLATTSRSGFQFAGWFTEASGGTQVTDATVVSATANHTLYAQWNAGVAITASAKHYIRGQAQNTTTHPLDYYQTATSTVGTGGASGSITDTTPVFGFTLPTLPAGAVLESATFDFAITAARDSTGGGNLPDLHAYLIDSEDPTTTGTTFFYHGALDPSADVQRIGTTSVTISGTDQVAIPAEQQARSFTLSGDSLALLQSYYSGSTPTRTTAYFRFNLSEDPANTTYRRYILDTTEAGSSLLLTYRVPANTAPTWTSDPITKTTATVGNAYSASLAADASDADNDPLNFAKVSGPDWLSVAADGTLSGTPAIIGTSPNAFVVSVSDGTATPVETTLNIPVQSAFAGWADGTTTFTGDANGDGVADGLAWLLGGDTPQQAANSLLPDAQKSADTLQASFHMRKPSARGAAVLRLQYSNDLGVADAWTSHSVIVPDTSGAVDGVDFTITAIEGTDLNQVQATVPSTAANGTGKLFIRLAADAP